MDNTIGVDVGEGQGYVMAKVYLSVVGEWFVTSLLESGQTLIH